MRIISAKDHGDSFRTLESGRAVAFMMDDALLAGERAKAKKPDNWEIVGKPQSQEAYGCMLRKDDPQFKKLMDDTIAQVQTSGEAEKWFDKWFKNPIPPKNLNMNFELSDEMKALFLSLIHISGDAGIWASSGAWRNHRHRRLPVQSGDGRQSAYYSGSCQNPG